MSEQSDKPLHPLRAPCTTPGCESLMGVITERGAQDLVHCHNCTAWQYNAPRTETGKPVRNLRSRPNIRPGQRTRVLTRDANRCIYCGRGPHDGIVLTVGHLISIADGGALGLTEAQLYHDENLAAMCEEDNSGLSSDSVPARIVAALVQLRANPGNDPR